MKLVILSTLVIVACGLPFPQSFPFLELTSNLRDTFRNFLNGTLSRSNSTNFLSFGFENVTFNTSRFQRFLNRTLATTPFLHELGNPVDQLTCLTAEQRTALKPCENSSVNTCQPACALKQAGALDTSGRVIQANLASIITSTNLTTAQKNASLTCLNKCLALNVTGVMNTLQAVYSNVTGTSLDPSCVVAGAAASCVLQALLKNGCGRHSRFGALVQAPEEDKPVEIESSLLVELGQLVQGDEPTSESSSEENEDVAEAQAQVGKLAFLKAYSNDSESESEEGSDSSSEEDTTTTATRVKRVPKAADSSNSNTGVQEFGEDLDFEDTYVENGGSDTNLKPSNGTGWPDRQRGGSQGTGNTDKARGNGRSADSRRGGNHGGEQHGGGGRGRGHGKHGRNCTTTTSTTTDATATETDAEATVNP